MMMQDMKLDWLPPAMEETVKRIEAVSGTVEGPETLKAALADALGSKGKMYRPLLLLMCAGAPEHWLSRDRVISTAAAVELTHTASLIHDDVVDDAPIRRGPDGTEQVRQARRRVRGRQPACIRALRFAGARLRRERSGAAGLREKDVRGRDSSDDEPLEHRGRPGRVL